MSYRLAVLVAGIGVALTPSSTFAHNDDPKAAYRTPPFIGPAYRAATAAVNQPGPGISLPSTGPGINFTSENFELLSWLPLSEFGPPTPANGNDCWGYVSSSGREYGIIGLRTGTAFVEVTDPGNAQIVGFIGGISSLWRDIKVYQDFAYSVSEGTGSGIQVINMSGIDNGVVSLVRTIDDVGTSRTHNVAINEASGFLYRCGGGSTGLRIYTLADPSNPVFVGQWNVRYVHDAQVVTMSSGPFAGRELAFCCTGFNGGWVETGLDILDVTNKQNIVQVDRIVYANGEYSHQGWLSSDRNYFFLGDELDEGNLGLTTKTFVFNVSNPSDIVANGSFTNGSTAVGHNMYTRGNLLFQANYLSGVRVFDVSDPLNGVEVAWFDTHPESEIADFDGAWSVYPYFPSGTVIVSDMSRGLFVLRLTLPVLGDLNCDGVVTPSDIAPFVLALTTPGEYAAQFPNCNILNADFNGDGLVTPSDIAGFVAVLTGM